MKYLDKTGLQTIVNKTEERMQANIDQALLANTHMTVIGMIDAYAGTTVPEGWLLCNGSAVSRTTYAALFNVIGTKFGAGDGSTTFNLPDLTDKFLQGSTTPGTVKTAGLPNITGYFNPYAEAANYHMYTTGAFGQIASNQSGWGTADVLDQDNALIDFDASRVHGVYGGSSTVQPSALAMQYIIRYKDEVSPKASVSFYIDDGKAGSTQNMPFEKLYILKGNGTFTDYIANSLSPGYRIDDPFIINDVSSTDTIYLFSEFQPSQNFYIRIFKDYNDAIDYQVGNSVALLVIASGPQSNSEHYLYQLTFDTSLSQNFYVQIVST